MLPEFNIPFHQPLIDESDIEAVVATLRSGWVTTGPAVEAFEKAFCEYIGAPFAVAVNSCTGAMHLSLAALGIGPGDAVVTTPYTFVATAEAIQSLGAKPIFADIREEDFNLDVDFLEKKLKQLRNKIRAVMPVHVAGHPCDMPTIMELANEYRVFVIEDAAHALEAAIRNPKDNGELEDGRRKMENGKWRMDDGKWKMGVGKWKTADVKKKEEIASLQPVHQNPKSNKCWWKVGNIGDATCFSFYATKNITTGEGGMVTTQDAELAEKIRCLSLHGMSRDAWKRYSFEGSWYYEIVEQGYKYNLPDILAALGLSQLKKVETMYKNRCHYAKIYEKELGELSAIITPKAHKDVRHAWHLYIIRLKTECLNISRNEFIKKLKDMGISTSVHFIPLHLHPFYQKRFDYKYGDFPVAEKIYESVISLPLYPKMSEEQAFYVTSKVRELVKENYKPTLFLGWVGIRK